MPLWADPDTVELFELLAERPKVLHVLNKAGVSVLDRFYVWSAIAPIAGERMSSGECLSGSGGWGRSGPHAASL